MQTHEQDYNIIRNLRKEIITLRKTLTELRQSTKEKSNIQCIRCNQTYLSDKDNDECICLYCSRIIEGQIVSALNKPKTPILLINSQFKEYFTWQE